MSSINEAISNHTNKPKPAPDETVKKMAEAGLDQLNQPIDKRTCFVGQTGFDGQFSCDFDGFSG